MRHYTVKTIRIPDRPDVLWIVVTPLEQILVNLCADPTAKILWLVQRLECPLPDR